MSAYISNVDAVCAVPLLPLCKRLPFVLQKVVFCVAIGILLQRKRIPIARWPTGGGGISVI